ncbi:hypothetical protein LTR08_004676 [Meristemomyces frigidus]|nr:hypothetical protein LTR08_004676 [Meristemomyces frigidus]
MLQLSSVPYDYYDPLFQKSQDLLEIVGVLCTGSGQQHLEFLLSPGLYVPFKQIISQWLEPIALPHRPLDNRDFAFKQQRDTTIIKHLQTGYDWEVNNADLDGLQREMKSGEYKLLQVQIFHTCLIFLPDRASL